MQVSGLGYEVEYFTLDGHEVIHATVPHVDLQVRAVAPVWLPHVPPAPLCGLGRAGAQRSRATRTSAPLCRACSEHLRNLDDWVRHTERELAPVAAGAGAGY